MGPGWALIRPSARPSIHRGNCQYACCLSIGRYSRQNNVAQVPQRSPTPVNSEGLDEVDNVMSNDSRELSPIPSTSGQPMEQRRKSVELPNSLNSDDSSDSDITVLATSLSASLPLLLPRSKWISFIEDYGDINVTNYDHHDVSAASYRSGMSHASTNTSSDELPYESADGDVSPTRYYESMNRRVMYEYERPRYPESWSQNTNKLSPTYTVIILGVLCVVLACSYGKFLGEKKGICDLNKCDELKFYNDLNDLGIKYRIRDDSILQVQTGISAIFEKNDTGSFIFVYNSTTYNYDPIEFNKFIESLASATSKYLRNDTTSVRHIVIDSSKLDMRSPSELIYKYREDITKTGLMLVKELDQVPSTLAMAFHYYCDEYNPIAKRSAIFFTLDMAKCSSASASKTPTHASIEKCLANKWTSVSKDSIGPLLARVVSVVVDVTSVSS